MQTMSTPEVLKSKAIEQARPTTWNTSQSGIWDFTNMSGRTEVAPTPTDWDVLKTGIASRAGAYPVLDPPELRGAGIVRERSVVPGVDDSAWEYSSSSRRLRRLPAVALSDSFGVP